MKPTIALIGFYARGNLGDEAILQAICRSLEPYFNFLIVVNEHGAFKGYWDWYPYNTYDRTDIGNVHLAVNDNISGVLVGGGDLGIGFGAAQACCAKGFGKKTILAGVDRTALPDHWKIENLKPYYSIFDYISFRNISSHTWGLANNIHNNLGADWCFYLSKVLRNFDTCGAVTKTDREILVVIREWPLAGSALKRHVKNVTAFLNRLKRNTSAKIVLCPFSPEDFRTLKNEFKHLRYDIFFTHNVEEMLKKFAGAAMVFSFGRLHPLIFAKICSVPVIPVLPSSIKSEKFMIFSKEQGYRMYWEDQLSEFNFNDIPAVTDFADERERLYKQIIDIVNLFCI